MPELPNIVISKLAGRQVRPEASLPDAVHPEPDLLTAFVEQNLPDRERTALLGHLADCAPCREILALTQPVALETQAVRAERRLRARGWFLRWGVLAACAAVAISAVVLLKQPHDTRIVAKQAAQPSLPASQSPDAGTASGLDAKRSEAVLDKPSEKSADAQASRGDVVNAVNAASSPKRQVVENGKFNEFKRHRAAGVAPGPSAMSNNAGYLANNSVSNSSAGSKAGSNSIETRSTRDLPLNGRNVTQLSQITPGVVGGSGFGNGAARGEAQKAASPTIGADSYASSGARADSSPVNSQDKLLKTKKEASARAEQSVGASAAPASAPAPPYRQGEIRGQVVDPSGASVGGARVTVTNAATGASVAATADSAGAYGVMIPEGAYSVAVSKPGFREFVQQGVQVGPSTVALTAKLEIGSVSETVEVTSQAASAETSSATVPYAPTGRDEIRASSAVMVVDGMVSALPAGQWQVTDAGYLQRSLDGGKSWQSVSVGPAVRLRVVAANGFQVWAGGNGGALFHSDDSGAHFAAVKIHRKHVALTGDIVSLKFTDARHGRIETADHEVWTTTDSGKSWRQPAVN